MLVPSLTGNPPAKRWVETGGGGQAVTNRRRDALRSGLILPQALADINIRHRFICIID